MANNVIGEVVGSRVGNKKACHVYPCPKCPKTYKSNVGLAYHMQQHTGKFSYWCDACEKGFAVKTNYNHHMAKHQGMTFPCNLCNKRFKSKVGLQYHQSEHTGNYIHYCAFCNKGFNRKSQLDEHIKICLIAPITSPDNG